VSPLIFIFRLLAYTAFGSTIACGNAIAQSSLDYAKMGQSVMPAFECSLAAKDMGDKKEQERLFKLGYSNGQKFIQSVIDGKVKRSDASSSVATGFLLVMEGPSIDFMLGRAFAVVTHHYVDSLSKNCDSCLLDEELRTMKAETSFREMNCALIQ
jgi:hypothetical protein